MKATKLIRFVLKRLDGIEQFVSSHQPDAAKGSVNKAGLVEAAKSILDMPHWRLFFRDQKGKVCAKIFDYESSETETIDLIAFYPTASDVRNWKKHNERLLHYQALDKEFSESGEEKKFIESYSKENPVTTESARFQIFELHGFRLSNKTKFKAARKAAFEKWIESRDQFAA